MPPVPHASIPLRSCTIRSPFPFAGEGGPARSAFIARADAPHTGNGVIPVNLGTIRATCATALPLAATPSRP
jgi:hypothetical protein